MLEIDLSELKGFKFPLNTMIKGLSNKDYHEAGGLSSTRFDLIRKSVRVFKFRHLFDTWKPCFDEGTLCHDCILTPSLSCVTLAPLIIYSSNKINQQKALNIGFCMAVLSLY